MSRFYSFKKEFAKWINYVFSFTTIMSMKKTAYKLDDFSLASFCD